MYQIFITDKLMIIVRNFINLGFLMPIIYQNAKPKKSCY
jgi:hypothetical protein